MSWLRRAIGRESESEAITPDAVVETVAAPEPEPAAPPELAILTRFVSGESDDETRALEAFSSLVSGPNERAALALVLSASRSSPALSESAAHVLLRRGDAKSAALLLDGATTVSALALRGEAFTLTGELYRALASVEEALRVDVRAYGLRERRDELRARLGLAPHEAPTSSNQATLVTAGGPRISYRLVGEAGRGGAATVYRAEDDELGRTIALKLYHRPREHRDQIEREARVASAMAGPGIVRVLDASLEDGWIALAWAEGGSLRDAIAKRLERAAPSVWFPELVSALARVHRAGWVHGDLKPGNILFRRDEKPLLADFGLARRAGEALTAGTPGYLSPARLAGRAASASDDVFALGRTLEDALARMPDPRFLALAATLISDTRPTSADAIDLG
jgi:serine/threonine-protein kinase